MEIKFLKPIAKVRDPQTKEFLPIEGRRVEMNTYWKRRVQDGTVMVVKSQTAAFSKIEKPPTEKSSKRGTEP